MDSIDIPSPSWLIGPTMEDIFLTEKGAKDGYCIELSEVIDIRSQYYKMHRMNIKDESDGKVWTTGYYKCPNVKCEKIMTGNGGHIRRHRQNCGLLATNDRTIRRKKGKKGVDMDMTTKGDITAAVAKFFKLTGIPLATLDRPEFDGMIDELEKICNRVANEDISRKRMISDNDKNEDTLSMMDDSKEPLAILLKNLDNKQ